MLSVPYPRLQGKPELHFICDERKRERKILSQTESEGKTRHPGLKTCDLLTVSADIPVKMPPYIYKELNTVVPHDHLCLGSFLSVYMPKPLLIAQTVIIRDQHEPLDCQFVLVHFSAKQVFGTSQPCLLQQVPTQRQHLDEAE